MTTLVFIGPTLRPEDVSSLVPDAVCLPPVAQGDVFRAASQAPKAIGIVDGYFSGAPSVWHKEILWALSEGVPVFGSASMGALRAAELHQFGMRGVGRIFEAYRDGVLEDDDEVAVVHGPAETGFMAASEPMVNIRATLARAEADGVISAPTRFRLEAVGKSLFFPHRTWPAVLRAVAGDDGLDDRAGFETWLAKGAIDQKREDALEMLAVMQDAAATSEAPAAGFRFERTHFWDDLVERSADAGAESRSVGRFPQQVVDELRLLGPDVFLEAKRNALLRLLAAREAERRALPVSAEVMRSVSAELRRALGLFSRSQLDEWISANDLDARSYEKLVESEAQRGAAAASDRQRLDSCLLDELRLSGRYRRLADRARDKAESLGVDREDAARGLPNTAQLRAWYFEQRLGAAIPDDIRSFADALGFATLAEFDRALVQEFIYIRLARGGPGSFDVAAEAIPPQRGGK